MSELGSSCCPESLPIIVSLPKSYSTHTTRWSMLKSDWLYSLQPKMEKLYTVNKKQGLELTGSDHELLITKLWLKLKEVGKTTRPFRYAAVAKLLQLCLTLCDPIDGSPPGSSVRGILQARILEWVAISFSNAWKWKVKVKVMSDSSRPHGL